MGEDETGWGAQGKTNLILDNLIAEKKSVPMIIVMDNGYASKPSQAVQTAAIPPRGPDFSAFEEVLIQEIIPMIDAAYRYSLQIESIEQWPVSPWALIKPSKSL